MAGIGFACYATTPAPLHDLLEVLLHLIKPCDLNYMSTFFLQNFFLVSRS